MDIRSYESSEMDSESNFLMSPGDRLFLRADRLISNLLSSYCVVISSGDMLGGGGISGCV